MLLIAFMLRYFLAHVAAIIAAAATLVLDLRFGVPVEGQFYGIEIVTYLPVNLAAATVGAWLGVYFIAKMRSFEDDGRSEKDERVVYRHNRKMVLLAGGSGAGFGLAAATPFLGVWGGLLLAAIVGVAMVLVYSLIRPVR